MKINVSKVIAGLVLLLACSLVSSAENSTANITEEFVEEEFTGRRSLQSTRCGCSSCTSPILNRNADGHRVVARIDWLKTQRRKSEEEACKIVCGNEFPNICGRECNPDQCSSGPSPNPPSNSLRDRGWSPSGKLGQCEGDCDSSANCASGLICFQRNGHDVTPVPGCSGRGTPGMDYCIKAAPTPTPRPPTPRPPTPPTGGGGACGCSSCSPSILNRNAGRYKVSARINWLKTAGGKSEEEACKIVCGNEFPNICGRECDPRQCGGGPTPPSPTPPTPPTGGGGTCRRNDQLAFVNRANRPVWIYNFPYGSPVRRQPELGRAIASGETLCLTMSNLPIMRVYVADKRLTNSLERGVAIDSGNPSVDGAVMFSFFEYFYEPGSSQYTVDLSYIDEYSYPLTVRFNNVGNYGGAVENHEYGPKSLSRIRSALAQQRDFNWKALIWPLNGATAKWTTYPPMYRVIGPLKVWAFQNGPSSNDISPFAPNSFIQFFRSLPKTGRQLFGAQGKNNWDGWNFLNVKQPSNTGYVRALHSVSQPDSRGKYGFFCYPIDNVDGEFALLPISVKTTVVIYPYNT